MDAPQWSHGCGDMSGSAPEMADIQQAGNAAQALAADSRIRPISNIGNATRPNPPQHRVRRRDRPICLPTQEELAAILATALKGQTEQSINTINSLANHLATQLHIAFGSGRSPHQLVPARPANQDDRSDIDSDVSWASHEESGPTGGYLKQVERDIIRVSKIPGGHVLTIPLKTGARKLVHWFAKQNDCSHWTLEDGRMLISADAFEPSYKQHHSRTRSSSWSRRTPTVGYCIVPNAVTIRDLPVDLTPHDVMEKFKDLGISTPTRLEPAHDTSDGHEAEFDNADDVADFWQRLHGKALRHGDKPLHIVYLRRPVSQCPGVGISRLDGAATAGPAAAMPDLSQNSSIYADDISPEMSFGAGAYVHVSGNGKLPEVVGSVDPLASFDSTAFSNVPAPPLPRSLPSIWCRTPTIYQQTEAGPSTYNPQHLVPPLPTRKRPYVDPFSDDGSSYDDLSGTDESAASGSKRMRHPRIKDGYPCGKGSCDKTFDTHGECNKHRRNHLPNDQRAFPCPRCHQAFLDAKDFRRHLEKGHKIDTTIAKQIAEAARPRAPPPPVFQRSSPVDLTLQIPDEGPSTIAASSPYTQDIYTPSGGGSQDQSPGVFVDQDQFPDLFPLFSS